MSTLKVNNIQNLSNTVGIDASTSTIHTTSTHAVLEGQSSVSLVSNSITGLSINDSGIVTRPNIPSFYARGSGSLAFSGTTVTRTDIVTVVVADNLSNFNTSTNRFTAPVAGWYYFHLQSATTTSTSSGPALFLYVNGSSYQETGINYNAAYYNTFGGSAVAYLEAGDYAQLAITNYNNTSFTIEMSRTRFGGFLIG
jgi:hypothetical protein